MLFRVQDEHGCGPYQETLGAIGYKAVHGVCFAEDRFQRRRPCVYDLHIGLALRILDATAAGWIFGFVSEASLLEWFDFHSLCRLHAAGYEIAIFELLKEDQIIKHSTQCVFDPRVARLVSKWSIEHFVLWAIESGKIRDEMAEIQAEVMRIGGFYAEKAAG